MRRYTISSLVVLLAVALAGCGGTSKGAAAPTHSTPKVRPGQPMLQISVTEREWSLVPQHIQLIKPGIYRFQALNAGRRVHSLTIVSPAGAVARTAWIKPGQSTTVDVVISSKGRYRLFDPHARRTHPSMTGVAVLG